MGKPLSVDSFDVRLAKLIAGVAILTGDFEGERTAVNDIFKLADGQHGNQVAHFLFITMA